MPQRHLQQGQRLAVRPGGGRLPARGRRMGQHGGDVARLHGVVHQPGQVPRLAPPRGPRRRGRAARAGAAPACPARRRGAPARGGTRGRRRGPPGRPAPRPGPARRTGRRAAAGRARARRPSARRTAARRAARHAGSRRPTRASTASATVAGTAVPGGGERLGDVERVAAGQRVQRGGVAAAAGGQPVHRGGRQRPQGQPVHGCRGEGRRAPGAAGAPAAPPRRGRSARAARAGRRAGGATWAQHVERGVVGPVQVLDDQDGRPPRGELGDGRAGHGVRLVGRERRGQRARASGPAGGPGTASRSGPSARGLSRSSQAPASTRTPWSRPAAQRPDDAGLADPRLAGDERGGAPPGGRRPRPRRAGPPAPGPARAGRARPAGLAQVARARSGSRSATGPSLHRVRRPGSGRRTSSSDEPTGPGTCHRAGRRGGP